MCGIFDTSAISGFPEISLPSATDNKAGVSAKVFELTISERYTICLSGLGISKPIQVFPGMVSTTLTLTTDNALAKSLAKFIT